jgi:hypothetical protein
MWIWVAQVVFAAVLLFFVVWIGRRAWPLLRGEEQADAGGSWGRQITTRRDKDEDV